MRVKKLRRGQVFYWDAEKSAGIPAGRGAMQLGWSLAIGRLPHDSLQPLPTAHPPCFCRWGAVFSTWPGGVMKICNVYIIEEDVVVHGEWQRKLMYVELSGRMCP